MNTVKFEKKNVRMIAHRGLSALEKENTNAAFIAAGNRSYFGIETDIHRTGDGQFAVIHDDTTVRVAGDNLMVEESCLTDLRNLLLPDIDGTKVRYDIRIPSLDEYIIICKKYQKTAVLELKSDFSKREIERIIAIIDRLQYLDQVIFISFDLNVLKRLREICPQQPAQYLVGKYSGELLSILIQNKLDLDILYTELSMKLIEEMHQNGIKVNCWTVDSPADGERLASWGVDYITSNILE